MVPLTCESGVFIKSGEIVKLGYPYQAGMPLSSGRSFAVRMPKGPAVGPIGHTNRAIFNGEFVSADLGQVGTHMDALGHVGCQCGVADDYSRMLFYNGTKSCRDWAPHGLKRLGIEHAPVFFTRGVLFDVVALKGRSLRVGEEILTADLVSCLDRQGLSKQTLQPGEAALIRTGYAECSISTPSSYHDGSPGIGLDAARWLSECEVSVVGADTYAVEVDPNPDPDLRFPCHHCLIGPTDGIYLQENMKLDELSSKQRYEFAYSFTPLPIVGATGSPGTPLAIL